MYYKFVLNLLLAILPAVYLYFYPITSGRSLQRKIILGLLSLASVFVLTQMIEDQTHLQYMLAILPFSYAVLYAGKIWGILIPVVLLAYELIFFTTVENYLQYSTYLIILAIVFLLSRTRFHMFESWRKVSFVVYTILIAIMLLMLYSLQFPADVSTFLNAFGPWEIMIKSALFVAAILLSYSANLKLEQALRYKKQYENMKLSHDELKTWVQVIQYAPFAVLNVNRHEQITYANQQALQNYSKLNQVGIGAANHQVLSELLSEGSYPIVSNLIQRVFESNRPLHTSVQSEEQDLMYSAIPIFSTTEPDELYAVALFVQDVTELQALRRELDRMDRLSLVGEMAASITHEIRNPMSVVRGYIQLLQERSEHANREYFNIIIAELDRTNKIISDFLTLAQNKREQKLSFSLNEVVRELVPLLQADANLRGQSLVVELNDDLPHFQINEAEIKQLLLNISRNGMEAMKQGGELCIRTSIVHQHIVLSITDTGSGIPDELKQKIFEPFYSSKSTGTGLGLPLCANIVQRHHGKIHVLNNDNRGTIFEIVFPLEQQLLSS